MSKYRYLSNEDKKKMNNRKKQRKFVYKLVRRTLFILILVVIFTTGIVAFYNIIDKGKSEQNPENFISEDKNMDTTIYSDRELESSLEKEESNDEKDILKENDGGNEISNSQNIEKAGNKANDKVSFSEWNKNCVPEMVLVNGDNALSSDYRVETKVCRGKEVNILAEKSLEKMIQDAAKEGITLWISSGYRSIKYQEKLFNNQIEREMAKGNSREKAEELAKTVVAKPGTSEHNTGLAIDFNGVKDDFYKTKEYKWLMDNAAKYGFIERYQEKWRSKTGVIYEPWHFRYVGEYAERIKESNLCLEDYIAQNLM